MDDSIQLCIQELRHIWSDWLASVPKRMEVNAALKDIRGLFELAPQNPGNLASNGQSRFLRLAKLSEFVSALKGFLKHVAIPSAARSTTSRVAIESPYMGGTLVDQYEHKQEGFQCSELTFAVLNPGRLGLSRIASEELLLWRLFHICSVLVDKNIQVCILPGARWPPGAEIPAGFPFEWLGLQTTSWEAVGVLVASELRLEVSVMEDMGSPVILWLMFRGQRWQRQGPALILGAIYPKPGGDLQTWRQILSEFDIIKTKYPSSRIVIAGDGNVHLQGLVHHSPECSCLHCCQRLNDKLIQLEIESRNLVACNPRFPTHVSGTIIDLVLTDRCQPLPVDVVQEDIGASDHFMVISRCPVSLQASFESSVGRVIWSQSNEWDEALASAESSFALAALITNDVQVEIAANKHCLLPKRKRDLLDAAAWIREVLVCFTGHCGGLTRVRGVAGQKNRWPQRVPKVCDFQNYDQYKAAVKQFDDQTKAATVSRYLSLLTSQPNQAKAFLSSWFKKDRDFGYALAEPNTGAVSGVQQTISAIQHDLLGRADNDFYQDPECERALEQSVRTIHRHKAVPRGIPGLADAPESNTAVNAAPYSWQELEEVQRSFRLRKQSYRCALAAAKTSCPPAKALNLALVNLARECELTSSLWCERRITPIRKAGPRVVRKVTNLRPISVVSDMAAVQDGLWLGRCKKILEDFTGAAQLGGKFETVAIVLAVILHAQIRHSQGLHTYLLFADIQSAYDATDHNAMLLAAFHAGVVGTEWLLLWDFLHMDSAVLSLGGVVSDAMSFRAGLPQGKRFAVHIFTAFMKLLQQILSSVCQPSNSVLPSFAADAIAGLWTTLTPVPELCRLEPLNDGPAIVARLQRLMLQGWDQRLIRRVAIHDLGRLNSIDERVQILENLGHSPLGPLLFIDDVVAPFPSCTEVCKAATEGLDLFAHTVRAKFNMGPSKTAIMPCYDAPDVPLVDIACETYKLLGVQLERGLSLEMRLAHILKVGNALFQELMTMAKQAGFPPPVLAVAITERVEPVILYAAELLPLVPNAYSQLNRLQADWAKQILAGKAGSAIRGPLAVATVGWHFRLGTKAKLRALAYLAKISILPQDHPVYRMVTMAESIHNGTWLHMTRDLLEQCGGIPPLQDSGVCTLEEMELARSCKALRKTLLQRYKRLVLTPRLSALDLTEFAASATKVLAGLNLRYIDLCPVRACQGWDVLLGCVPDKLWDSVELWSFTRLTGLWPLRLLLATPGHEDTLLLKPCPFCQAVEATLQHCLQACPGTCDLFGASGLSQFVTRRTPDFISILFHSTTSMEVDELRIRYVAEVIRIGILRHVDDD